MYIEHYGTMTVKNVTNGEICLVEFKKKGWSGKNFQEVEGYVYANERSKEKLAKIWGKWTERLWVKIFSTNEEYLIWEALPMPPNYESMYYFTYFTL